VIRGRQSSVGTGFSPRVFRFSPVSNVTLLLYIYLRIVWGMYNGTVVSLHRNKEKRPEREADHVPPSDAEVTNAWRCTSVFLVAVVLD
jgi:hypothetical protein